MNADLYWFLRKAVGEEGLSDGLTDGMNEALDEIEARLSKQELAATEPTDQVAAI